MAQFIASQLYSPSLALILLVIALALDVFLAVTVYFSNRRSATNKIFAVLTICTMFWLVMTYAPRVPQLFDMSLTIHRLGIFFAAPMSAAFFLLAHTMPSDRIQLKKPVYSAVLLSTLLMMVLNLSPFAFVRDVIVDGASNPQPGPGLIPFSVLSTLFSVLAVYLLIRKYFRSTGPMRRQFQLVLSGMLIMLVFIIATILVPILLTGSVQFLAFTPLYALTFLGMTAYAITKYQLFSMKVLITQALTLVLVVVLFARLFGEQTTSAQIIDLIVLIVVSIFGFFLVRSVRREVEQRVHIEQLAKDLEKANEQQVTLIHFITHQVKGFVAKSRNIFSLILDGDFGPVPDAMRPMIQQGFESDTKGVATIQEILNAANIKSGKVTYTKESFDLRACILDIVRDLKDAADAKHLELTLDVGNAPVPYTGDQVQLTNALKNLIDNSIKYTPSGSVHISLIHKGDTLQLVITDTGIGITAEDMRHLFTEGGHGKDSTKINVDSTGFGLYIVKNIVEAHNGTVRAESDGAGTGSRFIVELPVS